MPDIMAELQHLLDYQAAKYGQKIVDDAENSERTNQETYCTNALMVLNEQGIFSMFLWLHQRNEYIHIGNNLSALLQNYRGPDKVYYSRENVKRSLENVRNDLVSDIEMMIVYKDLIDRTLVYARHYAKCIG